MAWIEGTEERTFRVDAPADRVAEFFASPAEFKACMTELESAEPVEDDTWRWVLEEKGAKGLSFQGEYTVRYERDGHQVTWTTVRDSNMRSEGSVDVESLDDGTSRVTYQARISADLPIPKLMAKAFEGIIANEVTKGVGAFLDNAKRTLDGGV
jgi:carbon monoxide dehydrogenase subunit G